MLSTVAPHVGRGAGEEGHSGQQECMAPAPRSLGQAEKPWTSAILFSVNFWRPADQALSKSTRFYKKRRNTL